MYPLLRQLESRGLIEGQWEHPERRTRRYYSITGEGQAEYERLRVDVRPFLDSVRPLDRRDRRARCTADAARAGGPAVRLRAERGGRALDQPGPLADLRRGLRARARAGSRVAERGLEAGLAVDPGRARPGDRARGVLGGAQRGAGEALGAGLRGGADRGTQTISFEPAEGGTRVALELRYELQPTTWARQGPIGKLADVLFIRRALRDALRRTLRRFAIEAEEEAGPVAFAAAGSRRSRIPDSGGHDVRIQSRRRRRGHDGRRDRPDDRLRRRCPWSSRTWSRSSSTRASRRPARSPRVSSAGSSKGEDHPGGGRPPARGDRGPDHRHHRVRRASATWTS